MGMSNGCRPRRWGVPAGDRHPPMANDINVAGVDLQAVADALSKFGRYQSAAAAEEAIVDHLTLDGVVQDGTAHQFDGLLGAVAGLLRLPGSAVRIRVWHIPNS